MRVVIYDAHKKDFVSRTWALGAWLYPKLNKCDQVIPAYTWEQALDDLIAISEHTQISSVQFWGHGWFGRARIGEDTLSRRHLDSTSMIYKLSLIGSRMKKSAVWWWRTCITYSSPEGKEFASAFTNILDRNTAGSTYNIGLLHGGIRPLVPKQTPYWSDSEGAKYLPNENINHPRGLGKNSLPWTPNTITFWHDNIPTSFYLNG